MVDLINKFDPKDVDTFLAAAISENVPNEFLRNVPRLAEQPHVKALRPSLTTAAITSGLVNRSAILDVFAAGFITGIQYAQSKIDADQLAKLVSLPAPVEGEAHA